MKTINNDNTLELIIIHGLSIRQIPYSVTSLWGLNKGDSKMNADNAEFIQISEISIDLYNKRIEKGMYTPDLFRYENGFLFRKVLREVRIPEDAGFWMVQKSVTTDTLMRWDKANCFLAPTLAEAVKKYIDHINKKTV